MDKQNEGGASPTPAENISLDSIIVGIEEDLLNYLFLALVIFVLIHFNDKYLTFCFLFVCSYQLHQLH